jgi:uncharacterized protein (TIGR04141 family)
VRHLGFPLLAYQIGQPSFNSLASFGQRYSVNLTALAMQSQPSVYNNKTQLPTMSATETENIYNIFRIPTDKIDSLKSEFINKGLTLTKSKTISGYSFSFYFSKKDPESPVKWMDLYKEFLPDEEERFNRVYFASLLIETKLNYSYAISLGNAHFYIAKYSDSDFGLDLAERIATQEIKEKYTKYFFNNKNQSLIKYRDENDIEDSESGEYFQHIKSATVPSGGWSWGKVASFGNSVILKVPLTPDKLHKLIKKIEAEIVKPVRVNIPRVKKIKDKSEIDELEMQLSAALNGCESDSLFKSVVISSKNFLLDDSTTYSIYVSGNKGESHPLTDFDIDSVREYCSANEIDLGTQLSNLRITISPENEKQRNEHLRDYIDFISDSYDCLLEGKWHRFNQSYLQHLDDLIDRIKIEPYNESYNINKDEFDKYLKAHTDSYVEKYFNELRESDGYLNKDRFFLKLNKRYTIELLDLYKDKCIYFVKVGIPQKLSYVIDQAINTLQLLKNNKAKIIIGSSSIRPKRICLWIVLDRKKKISKLSEFDSLIFKWKLAEWVRLAKSLKIEPVIAINYRQ